MEKRNAPAAFTSALSAREAPLVLAYLPVHILLVPLILQLFTRDGRMSATTANFLYYAVAVGYLLSVAIPFLRRDFDPLADRPLRCLLEIITGYFAMMCFNFCMAYAVLLLLPGTENPNNSEVVSLVFEGYGVMKATLLFLGPLAEELMFRAGVFGVLRRRNRALAYAVSILAFSVFHVWNYALQNPVYWVYLLEYIPAAWLLARCYERTNSIWCSIFFHMMVNGVAVNTLDALRELM